MASTKNRANVLEILYRISNLINTTVDRKKVLNGIMKEVVRVTDATSGSISMFDREQGVLVIETAIGIPKSKWQNLKLHLGVGVTGWAAYEGKSILVDDVRRDLRYVALKRDIRSELAVPMFLKRHMVGVINVDSTRGSAFTEEHRQLLSIIAEQAARVIETSQLYERLEDHTHQITSLFNLNRLISEQATPDQLHRKITDEAHTLLGWDSTLLFPVSESGTELMKPECRGTHRFSPAFGELPNRQHRFSWIDQARSPNCHSRSHRSTPSMVARACKTQTHPCHDCLSGPLPGSGLRNPVSTEPETTGRIQP